MNNIAIHKRLDAELKVLGKKVSVREVIFMLVLALCFTPWVSPPVALALGIVLAQWVGHPYLHLNHKATTILLQLSVVGLGFGMNVHSAMAVGKQGFLFTVCSIFSILIIGFLVGRFFGINKKATHLISCGTAICGGSAIAAISPVVNAEEKDISVSLATVFILNSIALFIFPAIGHAFDLTQNQFGLWAAIAIHDTSSVVGAASKYGSEALQAATTVKLARALWIIPVSMLTLFMFKGSGHKIKIPWFIGWFVVAMIINTYLPIVESISPYVVSVAKTGLTITLFLIGAGLSRNAVKAVGVKPLLLGIILWVLISTGSLYAIVKLIH